MNSPFTIEASSLSEAWYKTLDRIVNHSGKELTPLVISISEFIESPGFSEKLNVNLASHNLDSVETVSETIFPQSLYELCRFDRQLLYARYAKNLPRIKAVDSKRNGRGTYFERLIAYGQVDKINQLEIVIESLQEESTVKRRSKLQASIFDPLLDHTTGMFQGFPCLQHVTFYKTENNGLVLNAFYAIQYLYQRGYGNWLGLINLARFVANETGLSFERFNCFIGVEKLDKITKSEGRALLENLVEVVTESE